MNLLSRFWNFLKEDTWSSWMVSLLLLVILIKFIFFPGLSLITSSPLPLVVIESCSLYHGSSFDAWWQSNGAWYESRDITKSEFSSFRYKNGLNKGDIIFVWGRSDYNMGDIIIFQPNPEATAPHPIIHRIIGENPIETKGDHNPGQLVLGSPSNPQNINEKNIPKQAILGKSALRIPALGWVKLAFFEAYKSVFNKRSPGDNWFCRI